MGKPELIQEIESKANRVDAVISNRITMVGGANNVDILKYNGSKIISIGAQDSGSELRVNNIPVATTDVTTALDAEIEDLQHKVGHLIFTDVIQINPTFNGGTNPFEIIQAMPNGSELYYGIGGSNVHASYPDKVGTLVVIKVSKFRAFVKYYSSNTTSVVKEWTTTWREEHTSLSPFVEVATTSKINNLSLLNGWKKLDTTCDATVNRSGDLVTVSMRVANATINSNTMSSAICVLPVGFRPPTNIAIIREVKLRNSSHYGSVYIYDNGEVKINNYPTANLQLAFDISYSV